MHFNQPTLKAYKPLITFCIIISVVLRGHFGWSVSVRVLDWIAMNWFFFSLSLSPLQIERSKAE